MERKNKEKSKSSKIFTNLHFIPTKHKKEQNVGIESFLKSDNLCYLAERDFHEKIQKLFDSNKFSIGNQFDQKGSEKFLAEKNECLKCMDLDYTILEKKNSKKTKRKSKSKNQNQKRNTAHIKYFPPIKIISEKDDSFFSTESSKQVFREFMG